MVRIVDVLEVFAVKSNITDGCPEADFDLVAEVFPTVEKSAEAGVRRVCIKGEDVTGSGLEAVVSAVNARGIEQRLVDCRVSRTDVLRDFVVGQTLWCCLTEASGGTHSEFPFVKRG